MHSIFNSLSKTPLNKLTLYIVLASVLIASQVQYIQHGWINPDSVLYLEAAKLFSHREWQAGFEVFSWPFYALCIALVNTITQLGVHVSAQVLNVIFFSMATYSYIKIILLAGGTQKQIIAGALIWLSAQYMVDGVLAMLMRDEGFWAFFLLSIVFFIRFYQTHQLKHALLWQVCIIVATLFRIEAITYLILLPLILLCQTGLNAKQRCTHLLMAHAINIGLALIIIGAFTFNDNLSTKILGRLNEVFTNELWQQFTQHLTEKSRIMSSQVLGEYLGEFAVQGLLMTFIYALIVKTISATGLFNVILSGLAIKKNKQLFQVDAFKVLGATAIIALLNMALIITKVFVLSGRYVLALSFILMIFAAFYFAELLFSHHQNKKLNWLTIVLVLFMLGGALKIVLPKKHGYNYMQEAVAWVQENNKENKPVFYDQARMRYYGNEPFIGVFNGHLDYLKSNIENKEIYQYHYLLIESPTKKHSVIPMMQEKLPEYSLLKRFKDYTGRKCVLIYVKRDA